MNDKPSAEQIWNTTKDFFGKTIAAFLKIQLQLSWTKVKEIVSSGKIFIQTNQGKTCCTDPEYRINSIFSIIYIQNAKRSFSSYEQQILSYIVFEDSQVVVFDKPSGMMSVPYENTDRNTAMDMIRHIWKLQKKKPSTPLHIVHRIDKETSGLLVFAKTKLAERFLQNLLRNHEVDRIYLCLAHGKVVSQKIETYLIQDRGDGIRGSAIHRQQKISGKKSITHVDAKTYFPTGATLCEVRLETGRTHQIRIHLSEKGHPLVGEPVYNRDYPHSLFEAKRLMLHAHTLGFIHPSTGEKLHFTSPLPEDFLLQMNFFAKKHMASRHC